MVEIGHILLIVSLQIDTKISQSPVCFKTYHTFMKKMRAFLEAALLILQITTSLCQMRKTIKVLKFPKIGKFGGYAKPVAIHDFDPGDQKEATTCMKLRTFAYNEGFGCPFNLHTNGDWAEARDLFLWLYCVGWKTGIEEDDSKQVGISKLLFLGKDPGTKSDEFLEKFQMAFDPLPHFWKIILRFFYNGYGRLYERRHRPDSIS